MHRIYLYLLTACCITVLSCSEDEEVKQVVDEEVVLSMLPRLDHNSTGLQFNFRSDELFDCDDAGYDYTFKNAPEDISIHLLGVDVPDNCSGGLAPASENIEVPGAEGYYSIAIDIGEHIHNTGLLEVTEFYYKIYLYSRSGMAMPHELMYKIPQGTIWGYLYKDNAFVTLAETEQFYQALDSVTDPADMAPGYYGYFRYKPFSLVDVILVNTPTSDFASDFIFRYTGNPTDLQAKVDEVRQLLPPGVQFKLFSWQGENY